LIIYKHQHIGALGQREALTQTGDQVVGLAFESDPTSEIAAR
jgi:hypothetical protein